MQTPEIDPSALVRSVMPDVEVRGVAVVRDRFGRIKVDPGFDLSTLPEHIRQEIAAQE